MESESAVEPLTDFSRSPCCLLPQYQWLPYIVSVATCVVSLPALIISSPVSTGFSMCSASWQAIQHLLVSDVIFHAVGVVFSLSKIADQQDSVSDALKDGKKQQQTNKQKTAAKSSSDSKSSHNKWKEKEDSDSVKLDKTWEAVSGLQSKTESLQSTTNELQARVDSLESDLVECEEVDREPEPSTRDSQTRKRKVSDDLKFEQVMS